MERTRVYFRGGIYNVRVRILGTSFGFVGFALFLINKSTGRTKDRVSVIVKII